MTAKPFPSGVFVGTHRGVKMYSNCGKIQCLFGWVPKSFDSIRQAKWHIGRWRKEA